MAACPGSRAIRDRYDSPPRMDKQRRINYFSSRPSSQNRGRCGDVAVLHPSGEKGTHVRHAPWERLSSLGLTPSVIHITADYFTTSNPFKLTGLHTRRHSTVPANTCTRVRTASQYRHHLPTAVHIISAKNCRPMAGLPRMTFQSTITRSTVAGSCTWPQGSPCTVRPPRTTPP